MPMSANLPVMPSMIPTGLRLGALAILLLAAGAAVAQTVPAATPAAESPAAAEPPVVASGTVPDEATKSAVLTRLRALYGADQVVDRIRVDAVLAPPNWREHVVAMLGPGLRQIDAGQLEVAGNDVTISGTVANEAQRQQLASDLAVALNATYSVTNTLRAAGNAEQQDLLDTALAGRIIEFRSGSATLTGKGRGILDEMATALQRIGDRQVQIIGHTDDVGRREANVALSMDRAIAVKRYLEQRGVSAANLSVQGLGPDRPVADNDTPEGRARNRRIEFRVL